MIEARFEEELLKLKLSRMPSRECEI
jgi:hypothetical protein